MPVRPRAAPDPGQVKSEPSAEADIRRLLSGLEAALTHGDEDARAEAMTRLRDLGSAARPALPAIARAIGDTNDAVASKAVDALSQLWPAFRKRFRDLWLKLGASDSRTRLPAVAELVKLLPTIAPAEVDPPRPVKEDDVRQHSDVQPAPELRGKWIAWDEHRGQVLAAADTYPELLRVVERKGLADPVIERAPGLHPSLGAKGTELVAGESADILRDIRKLVSDPDAWLDSPNTWLGYERPRSLIGTAREWQLRYLLRGIGNGITS